MNLFPAIPFFRITLPFVFGILTAIYAGWRWEFGLLFVFPVFCVSYFLDITQTRNRILFMVLLDLSLFFFGLGLISFTDTSRQDTYYGRSAEANKPTQLLVLINDLPVEKEKTFKLSLSVNAVNDSGTWRPADGKLYAYIRKSAAAQQLKAGDKLVIDTRLQEVAPPMNPFVFDYKTYLFRKQLYHTAFVDSLSWTTTTEGSNLNPLLLFGLESKRKVLSSLKNSGLTPEAYAICAALLTGYDDDIDKGIMNAFSHSGTLHVLSVSGLHTGLIYLVLNYLLNFLDRKNRHGVLRFFVVTIVLWLFALLTGFSAPVLRAVIMFNFLGLGKLWFRGTARNQLNILLVSAFVLLVYNPWLIVDVGFLLSYFAMVGLIYFQPLISESWKPESRAGKSLWLSISASLSATISTLPITLFIFKQFPFWFFVCNLIVVPATFVILLLAFLIVLKLVFLVPVVNWLIRYLIAFIGLFDNPKWGYLDSIHFTGSDFLFMSLVIIFAAAMFQSRSYRVAACTLLLLLLWQCVSIYETYRAKNASLITVYQIRKESGISVKNKDQTVVSEMSAMNFDMNTKPHLCSFNYPHVKSASFNFIESGTETMLRLGNGEQLPELQGVKVTRLLLTGGRELKEDEIRRLNHLKLVIVDGTSQKRKIKSTEELCRKFDIGFYNTAESGALVLPL